ncbi:MAG TPA: hypothetical protein VF859_07890 [Burkholderiales bacterium]
MLPFELPAADPSAAPAFRSARDAREWISRLQLTNIQAAYLALATELEKLNCTALAAGERLAVMEELRETVEYVQGEHCKRLLGKPLPLSERDTRVLGELAALWQALALGYGHCLAAAIEGDPGVKDAKALLCYRCLGAISREMMEYVRLAYEFDPELWRKLNRIYSIADQLEVSKVPVPEPGGTGRSCQEIYVRMLLACQANPYEFTRRQLALVDRWLERWGKLVSLSPAAPRSGESAPPLEVNLSAAAGLRSQPSAGFSTSLRYLDMSEISKEIRVKTVLLSQGQSPENLELGTDCGGSECIELLGRLHRQWCEGTSSRMFERTPARGTAQVCFGLEASHFYVTGKPFRQPRKGGALTEREQREIAALGHKTSETARLTREQVGALALETWNVEDRSALGLRLMMRETPGERLAANRLIATMPGDSNHYALGVVRWVMVSRDGQLRAGVRTLPGDPVPAAVRPTGVNVPHSEKFIPAMLLPAIPAVQIPASLVIPNGWFVPKRVLELHTDTGGTEKVMLEYLIERGLDYERVSFQKA